MKTNIINTLSLAVILAVSVFCIGCGGRHVERTFMFPAPCGNGQVVLAQNELNDYPTTQSVTLEIDAYGRTIQVQKTYSGRFNVDRQVVGVDSSLVVVGQPLLGGCSGGDMVNVSGNVSGNVFGNPYCGSTSDSWGGNNGVSINNGTIYCGQTFSGSTSDAGHNGGSHNGGGGHHHGH